MQLPTVMKHGVIVPWLGLVGSEISSGRRAAGGDALGSHLQGAMEEGLT